MKENSRDKAGKDYWDSCWEEHEIPTALNPNESGLKNSHNRRLDKLLHQIFGNTETKGKNLLEVGCAMSIFLPYFAKEFGFNVVGLDYSEIGCEQERQILKKSNVEGEVVCADFFNPPDELKQKFDFVFSFGVAEHFVPTESCLTAFAEFLKPERQMITVIPNMNGYVGALTKTVNRPVYDIHVVMDTEQLKTAHEKAGLTVQRCDYFLSTGLGLANVSGLDQSQISTKIKKHLIKNLGRLSVLSWALEDKTISLPNSKLFSPYVFCVADKR